MGDTKGPGHRDNVDEELEDLRHEIELFKKEKERVRAVVGRIGGVPTFNTRLANIIFALIIVACFVASVVSVIGGYGSQVQLETIEIAVFAVSIKIMLLMHKQGRVNHFQLWIMSSLEWRLDQIMKEMKGFKPPEE